MMHQKFPGFLETPVLHARNLSENWNDGLLEYWNNGYQKKKEKSDGRME
jgi:hypothetical protein